MAEEETNEAEEGAEGEAAEGSASEESKPSSKSSIKLLGGVVALIATGTILAMMAMPKKEEAKTFDGPGWHTFFTDGEIVGNTLDNNFSRYLKFTPSCSYLAYDLNYPESRRADPQYETQLKELMQYTISQYTLEEVMKGTDHGTFAAELEQIAEPILFPVHIGPTTMPYEEDPESGLRAGDSQERHGTFRGPFYEHVLKVDATRKTIQLDDGPEQKFGGSEYDLLVESEAGEKLYVDVSGLEDDFVGEVHVGVMGRIRRLLTGQVIAQ
jgi:flagellar basal body-associated protein FliL